MKDKQAVIIVSHGSRNPKAKSQFISLVENVQRKKRGIRIEPAFFQLAEPSVSDVIERLVKEEFTRLSIVPFFLMHGNHVAEDIPFVIKEANRKYPDVSFVMSSTLYPSELLETLVISRVEEAAA